MGRTRAEPETTTSPVSPVALTPVGITRAVPVTTTSPTAPEALTPVTATSAPARAMTVPTAPVAETPVSRTRAEPVTVTVPAAPEADTPVGSTRAVPVTVTVPTAPVAETPVTMTGRASPQAPEDHAPRPQPVRVVFAMVDPYSYEILMIASDEVAAGNWMVKVPAVEILSPPKSRTATALFESDEL